MKFGSLFTGFGGADIGAMAAGFAPMWGVEYDAQIAGVANANLGTHVRVADVLACDPHDFAPVDLLHASPPCPNFSVAKANREETAHDIAMADKVAEFVRVLHPRFVTIENVPQYVKAESYLRILKALADMGYMYDVQVLNAADMGVPQTRRRLFVRAVYGAFVPMLPAPVKWVGWHEAIADMIDTLPETKFAEWQLKRLPAEMGTAIVYAENTQSNADGVLQHVGADEPVLTVRSDPIGHGAMPRAFIIDGKPDNYAGNVTPVMAGDAVPTVTASQTRHPMRAFIVEGSAAGEDNKFTMPVRDGDEPVFTMRAVQNNPRAWLSSGRVVSMTPRALARFQSFPDWYQLPDKKALACKGIGNAVPPLMYQRIAEGFAEQMEMML